MNVTDYDVAPSAKPLPLEHQLGTTESGIASRSDSASGGKIGFMDQNNKLDAEYALPGGGANSNASWVRTLDLLRAKLCTTVTVRFRQPLTAHLRRLRCPSSLQDCFDSGLVHARHCCCLLTRHWKPVDASRIALRI